MWITYLSRLMETGEYKANIIRFILPNFILLYNHKINPWHHLEQVEAAILTAKDSDAVKWMKWRAFPIPKFSTWI